jgi:FG-GAP repeat
MIITPTFTPSFDTNFGANAAAARAAWAAAAEIFTGRLSDDIHINITVDALPGTNVFGESFARLLSISYADLFNRISANATTQDDLAAVGPGGSMTAADPTNGAGTWWLTRAQAKALGVIPDDMSDDGGTTFGAGNPFTFAGQIAAGTFDFRGIAAHEISEVMGRLGLSGGTVDSTANSFSLVDNFSYTGPGTKGLRGGPGNNFSIDNGTTLLKLWNDPISNGLDSRDWAGGTNDAFNQFSSGGVVNPVSAVDLQLMDVIGYAPVWQHLSQIPGHPLQADFDCSGLPNAGRSVSVGDVDGDGRAEVIVQIDAAHSGGNDFWVMKFDPAAGIWQHLSQIPGHPLQADFDCSGLPNAGRSVSVGDVDGDGRAEVIVQIDAAHSGGNDFWVMKFDPASGSWTHLSPTGDALEADIECSSLPNSGRSLRVGDVDGDGRAEVIVQINAARSGGNDFWVMKWHQPPRRHIDQAEAFSGRRAEVAVHEAPPPSI